MNPPTKKARLPAQESKVASSPPSLFAPFRSLGHVTTATPFAMKTLSAPHLTQPVISLVTSVGRGWIMWDGGKMKVVLVGGEGQAEDDSIRGEISSLVIGNNRMEVFAASDNGVRRFIKGQHVASFVASNGRNEDSDKSDSDSDSDSSSSDAVSELEFATLTQMLIFGNTMIALEETGCKMFVWDIPSHRDERQHDPLQADSLKTTQKKIFKVYPYTVIEFPAGFAASYVSHPASYLNKVVVGSQEGSLAVWNVRTGVLLHTFVPSILSVNPSRITTITQAPALDVVAIGFQSGECILFDIRYGDLLGRVFIEEDLGSISAISFRDSTSSPLLAISTNEGNLIVYGLPPVTPKIILLHIIRGAHEDAINGAQWIPGQPVLITSGGDNAVKQWIFDHPTAPPRLLKQRSGHHAPPRLVRFYGESGKNILTSGADRALRLLSLVKDERGFELSQGSVIKRANKLKVSPASLKLPAPTGIAYSTARSRDWDDLITISTEEATARSWRVEEKRMGSHTFKVDGKSTACCITSCGNFGLIGTSDGTVVQYNMQSGLKRKIYRVPNSTGTVNPVRMQITGVEVDTLNRILIATTFGGAVHFFSFFTSQHLWSLDIPSRISQIRLQRESGLLAVACDDLILRVIDITVKGGRIVREFKGFRGSILDFAFSASSRWLITTCQDSIIRTFDIPTGNLIDLFKTEVIATSLDFSPTEDWLVTTHVGKNGVFLWSNRAQFASVSLNVVVEDESIYESGPVLLPTIQGDNLTTESYLEFLEAKSYDATNPYTTPEQLSKELITLTLLPRTRWTTLLNLETIKQRNKPKAPPKAPERAPFFLPTLPGTQARFDLSDNKEKEEKLVEKSRKLDFGGFALETDFIARLKSEEPTGDYESFFLYIKNLSPAATDLEIRSLSTLVDLEAFLNALRARLESHKDFEAVQTYLTALLRIHGDLLAVNIELKQVLEEIKIALEKEGERIMALTRYAIGALSFLRKMPIV